MIRCFSNQINAWILTTLFTFTPPSFGGVPGISSAKSPNHTIAALSNPTVLPPGSRAFGKTYAEWSVVWWQWFLPLTSEQFNACATAQSGKVRFLLAGPSSCNITISPGTALFIPVANAECSDLEPDPFHGSTPAARRACAQSWADLAASGGLGVEIDRAQLQNLTSYRILSPDFSFTVGPDNVFGIPCSGSCPGNATADGYYLLLTPLSAGTHTMHITAPAFGIDTTYTILVK